MWRGGRAGLGAGRARQEAPDVLRGATAVPDVEQGAGNGPDHVAQKAVAPELELDNPFVIGKVQARCLRPGRTPTSTPVMVRTVLDTGVPVDWNATKSCVPASRAAAAAIATRSTGGDTSQCVRASRGCPMRLTSHA